jgi:hypothetical protein
MILDSKSLEKFYESFRRNSFILWLENKSKKILPKEDVMEFLKDLGELDGFEELLELQRKYKKVENSNKTIVKKIRQKKNIRKLQDQYEVIAYFLNDFLKGYYGDDLVDDYYYYSENFYDKSSGSDEESCGSISEEEETDELGKEIDEFELTDEDLNEHELEILYGLIFF